MDQAATIARAWFPRVFSFSQRTPEDILVHTMTIAGTLLVGWALFDHKLAPLVPTGVLLYGWRNYRSRSQELKSGRNGTAPPSE